MNDISRKRKPKIAQQLKNFSPIAFEIKPIEWSIDDHAELHELKSLFLFMDDFDLHTTLANLPLDIATFVEIDRQKPTEKETITYLKKVKNKTSQSIASLQEIKALLPVSVKNKLLELNHLFEIMGSHHIKLISENTPRFSKNTRGSFTTMNEIRKALDFLCDEDFLNKLRINLLGMLQVVEVTQSTIPTPKAGRKQVNLETGIIHTLVYIYANGTGLTANCYWDHEQEQFAGKFYEFLLKAIGLLEKNIKIKPLSEQTWGDYAREAIKYHYRKQ